MKHRRPTDDELCREMEKALTKAETVADSLDDFLREETHEQKLVVISILLTYLAGHRTCPTDRPCPMDEPAISLCCHLIGQVMSRFMMTPEQVHYITSRLVAGLAMSQIEDRLTEAMR